MGRHPLFLLLYLAEPLSGESPKLHPSDAGCAHYDVNLGTQLERLVNDSLIDTSSRPHAFDHGSNFTQSLTAVLHRMAGCSENQVRFGRSSLNGNELVHRANERISVVEQRVIVLVHITRLGLRSSGGSRRHRPPRLPRSGCHAASPLAAS